MTTDLNTPRLRFAGFHEEWERRKFSDLYEVNKERNEGLIGYDKTLSVASMTFRNEGNGAAESSLPTYKVLRLGDIAFEGHRSREFKYGRFVVNDVGDGIMSPRFRSMRPLQQMPVLFWKYYIHCERVMRSVLLNCTKAGTMMNELVEEDFLKQSILTPTLPEQQKIGAFFSSLDAEISREQERVEKLRQLKAACLQDMFPREGENAPRVRFAGFHEEWERRKFSDLYEVNKERNEGLIGYDKTLSVASMTFRNEGNGAAESSLPTYKVLRLGDIAFEGHRSREFKYGRFVVNDVGDGIMSPRFRSMRPLQQMPVLFWKYYIHCERVMRSVLLNCTKAGTMMNELVEEDFLKQSILTPTLPEQQKIGAFFSSLDAEISREQERVEKLRQFKAACLGQMFVGG